MECLPSDSTVQLPIVFTPALRTSLSMELFPSSFQRRAVKGRTNVTSETIEQTSLFYAKYEDGQMDISRSDPSGKRDERG